ncbi:MAG: 7-carboxy-7-deazaguanine synthase QueE [Muribaculaceae bacterium]|nr:7-carboxy-7-deazaguanine synthase QueE [Muribaculaceae bacterium]
METIKDKTYPVNEIFYSLQGEGYHTGTPAVFLRFSGCNLKCDFCDTDHFSFTPMTADEILEKIGMYRGRHIVITGGEPTLTLDDALVEKLKSAGYYLQIETNGTNPVPPGVDWVTCSPKAGPWNIDRVDELKVVYRNDPDFPARMAALFKTGRLFLQPCSGLNIPETVEFILSNPQWRLSLQTHKLISIQ